ncbi:MAG: Fur family transcriptional regulator [Patescibacteria group bacterium]
MNNLADLKAKGFRITKARAAILDLLEKSNAPVSADEIVASLGVNKSTVYRELDFLESQDLITDIRLDNAKNMYESKSKNHHHHLYCIKCKKIEEVDMDNDLDIFEKKLEKDTKFKIKKHSLEFFGTCLTCQ